MNLIKAIVHRIINYFNLDLHLKEVISGASVAFFLKACGAGLGFGFNVLLARLLGAEGAGVYFLALTVTTIATVFGRMGLDNALLRFVAANAAQEKWVKVAGVYRKGLLAAVVASVLTACLVIICAERIAVDIFSEPALIKPVRIIALSVVPMSLLTLHAELLKGLKRIRDAMLVQGVGIPLVSILLLAVLGTSFGVMGAVAAYVGATSAVFLLSIYLWRRSTPQLKGIRGNFDMRLLLSTSMPLFLVASMNLVMSWTDTLMLGFWTDSESVGIYNVAMRTAKLTSFILISVNSIVAPKFAALYAKGEFDMLGSLARKATVLMTLITVPALLLFVLAPGFVLKLFGSEFTDASVVLVILGIGQFINVATGSVGYLLMMTRYEKLMRNNILFSGILNVCLNFILVPQMGIEGAALATAISLGVMNLISMGLVYWKLSIITVPIPKGVFTRGK